MPCSAASPDVDDPNIPTTGSRRVMPLPCPLRICSSGQVSSPSRGEARRKAAEGALWLDGERFEDVDAPFQPAGRRRVAPLWQEALPAHSHRALIGKRCRSNNQSPKPGIALRMTSISGRTSSNPASRSRSPATTSTRSASGPAGPPCRSRRPMPRKLTLAPTKITQINPTRNPPSSCACVCGRSLQRTRRH